MQKYPGLTINGQPDFQTSDDITLVYNDKTTHTTAYNPTSVVLWQRDFHKTNAIDDYIVDPNAVTIDPASISVELPETLETNELS